MLALDQDDTLNDRLLAAALCAHRVIRKALAAKRSNLPPAEKHSRQIELADASEGALAEVKAAAEEAMEAWQTGTAEVPDLDSPFILTLCHVIEQLPALIADLRADDTTPRW